MLSLLTTTKQTAAKQTTNDKNGNGKYRPLRNRKRRNGTGSSNGFRYLNNNDLTMQFDSTKDPIYFAFEYLENRSVPQLMGDFIQDSFFEIASFVSKVVK